VGSSTVENAGVFGAAAGLRAGPLALAALARLHGGGDQSTWQAGGVALWHFDLPPDLFVRASPFIGVHALYTTGGGVHDAVDLGLSAGIDAYLIKNASIGFGVDVGALSTGGVAATMGLRAGLHL
jgi:hypothetical protein